MPVTSGLTLKQRLAALTVNTTSSSSSASDPFSSPTSSTHKWRPLFLSRRSTEETFGEDVLGHDKIQDVMSRVVFQAGVDYETRPMVVMNASAFPDPKEVSYDLLLSRMMAYLDLYVEADYTVVFFAAGARHTPGWNWVWKAYRSLSRKYRKNLKRLIIVHTSFFTKMLISLAGAFISPKFFKKISYSKTLSELATEVPITQIDIPPAAYKENLKYEQQIVMPVPQRTSLFGVPLEEIMGYDGEKGPIPRVIRDCIQYLRSAGMRDEGLFRKSPSDAMMKQVIAAYNRGQVVSLEHFHDAHLAAVLIKRYMRELPEPLFPERLYPCIRRCPPPPTEVTDMSCILYIRETLLPELPHCAYILLSYVIHLLHEVSLRSDTNFMDAYNLSRCVTPTLARSGSLALDSKIWETPGGPSMSGDNPSPPTRPSAPGATTLGSIIVHCIQHYFEIFDELPDRTEARSFPAADSNVVWGEDGEILSSVHSYEHPGSARNSYLDDEEDIDDAILVMPVGPSASGARSGAGAGAGAGAVAYSPPSAWAPGSGPGATKYKPRHRASKSRESKDFYTGSGGGVGGGVGAGTARSVHTTAYGGSSSIIGTTNGGAFASGRARSTVSVEKGGPFGTSRKGSIAVGRGTTRKGAGSAVEAMGVTASGFFAPPPSAPPVPSLPK